VLRTLGRATVAAFMLSDWMRHALEWLDLNADRDLNVRSCSLLPFALFMDKSRRAITGHSSAFVVAQKD